MSNVMRGPDAGQSLRGDRIWALGVQLFLDQFDAGNQHRTTSRTIAPYIAIKLFSELITGRFQAWVAEGMGMNAPTSNEYEARRYLSQAIEAHCGEMVPRDREGWTVHLLASIEWVVDVLNEYVDMEDLLSLIEDPKGEKIPGEWRYETLYIHGSADYWELRKAHKIVGGEVIVSAIGATQQEARSAAVIKHYLGIWVDAESLPESE